VRSQFNEHSRPCSHLSFVFRSAAEAAARFKGEEPGPIYARFTNPTVSMMEARLAALEGAERCVRRVRHGGDSATVSGLMKRASTSSPSRSIFRIDGQLFSTSSPLGRDHLRLADRPANGARRERRTRALLRRVAVDPLTEVSDIRALGRQSRTKPVRARGRQLLLLARRCKSRLQLGGRTS